MTAEQANRARQEKFRAEHENRNLPAQREPNDDAARNEDGDQQQAESRTFGVALGLFSIGLGLAEIMAPRVMARVVGIKPSASSSAVMRAYGVREAVVGISMLMQPDRASWAWARVAGDALDIGTLLYRAAKPRRKNRGLMTVATMATVGVLAVDVLRARQLSPTTSSTRRLRNAPQRQLSTGESPAGDESPEQSNG